MGQANAITASRTTPGEAGVAAGGDDDGTAAGEICHRHRVARRPSGARQSLRPVARSSARSRAVEGPAMNTGCRRNHRPADVPRRAPLNEPGAVTPL